MTDRIDSERGVPISKDCRNGSTQSAMHSKQADSAAVTRRAALKGLLAALRGDTTLEEVSRVI